MINVQYVTDKLDKDFINEILEIDASVYPEHLQGTFKVSRYLTDYERSRTQLEQIVNIRKLNTSEKETRVVTYFAIILAVCQITPFIQAIVSSKFDSWKNYIKQNTGSFITLIIIAAFTAWFFFGKKIKKIITQIIKNEQSEKPQQAASANQPPKKKPMPPRCKLCVSGVLKVNCIVCDVMEYEE